MELAGKKIGIVGLGHIGMKVAHIAMDFGMEVYAFTSKNASELPDGIRKATMDGLFVACDIITLHCPLTDSTRELVNRERLLKVHRGAILVNTGRGQLVNEADAAEAWHTGQLGAYCADVMCAEPPVADNPLFREPNAFITPHVAWASMEARTRLMNIAENNIRTFLSGSPENVVNAI